MLYEFLLRKWGENMGLVGEEIVENLARSDPKIGTEGVFFIGCE